MKNVELVSRSISRAEQPLASVSARAEIAPVASVAGFPGVVGTFMGRDALALAMSHLGIADMDTVLLPAYTCHEVLRSFMKKVGVAFYDVGPDLAIDPDDIRRQLSGRRVKMLLTTDYFGFPQPYRHDIKRICVDTGTSLVEDCAHSLLTDGAGEIGDVAIYSFRKILPVHYGGGLRANTKGAELNPAFSPRLFSNALSLVAQVKSLLNIHSPKLSRARVASHTTTVISPRKAEERILPLSFFAQHGMANIAFTEVIEKRRDGFLFWLDLARGDPALVPVFPELPAGVCPLGFPVKVRDRASLESQARKAGIVLSVHWRLDRDIAPECRSSHKLSAQLLTLPVAPDIRPRERDTLARIVSERGRRRA
jgi:hypothetical protein